MQIPDFKTEDRRVPAFSQGAFMIDEKVKIRCTKCSQVFRERAQRVRNGFQTNCQHCNRLITFDSSSEDRNIRRALMSAKEIRATLEARPKAESVPQASAGHRSQF
jgi:predicted  nucleic acid-binding Zn-ribbon protein